MVSLVDTAWMFVEPSPSRHKVSTFMPKLVLLMRQEPSLIQFRDGAIFIPCPKLLEGVLDMYFKHQKYASFQRQLNNFGFNKPARTGGPANSKYVKVRGPPVKTVDDLLKLQPLHAVPKACGGKRPAEDEGIAAAKKGRMPLVVAKRPPSPVEYPIRIDKQFENDEPQGLGPNFDVALNVPLDDACLNRLATEEFEPTTCAFFDMKGHATLVRF